MIKFENDTLTIDDKIIPTGAISTSYDDETNVECVGVHLTHKKPNNSLQLIYKHDFSIQENIHIEEVDSFDVKYLQCTVSVFNQGLLIAFAPIMEQWAFSYSPKEFMEEIKRLISKQCLPKVKIIERESNIHFMVYGAHKPLAVSFIYEIDKAETKIGDAIENSKLTIEKLYEQSSIKCLKSPSNKSILTYFSFPTEIQAACEQYLLYFGDFLKDIGINASIELKEESNRILFAVTPKNSVDALDRISQILDLYLNLPTATLVQSEKKEYRIEIQKLSANIMHLRGQLILAEATIEAKDAIIATQRDRLIYQGQLLEGRLLYEPTKKQNEETKKEETDKIAFWDNIFTLTKIKKEGVEIDLPEMYRKLRDFVKQVYRKK